ncbi:MAG TPA: hypothetical protein VMV05_06780 [bacterium]|nr:hypothetical protein [bacterium]
MKKHSYLLALGLLAVLLPAAAPAQVQVGFSAGSGGNSFYLAVGNYYQAPQEQVAVCQQRHIPDEEMPVVFFIAQRAHVAPGVIVDLRAGGGRWVDIMGRYHLDPRILYVKGAGSLRGTPYARFDDYYHHRGRVTLEDGDIVNMVNLRFASDYYHRPAGEVVKMRAKYGDYRSVHEYYHPSPKPGRAVDRHDKRKDQREDRMDRRDDRRDDRQNDRPDGQPSWHRDHL